ncbi:MULTISPECIES: TonB-dependent receptor [unclassified Sphingopyxis]|uniref:TonB-dependent receptor n=1 Tax=unclassified Sphingopyxis TaxID=2614943 RepID=UPI000730207D|nr:MULTISPECIES: TonB-dependent receptor [unclassified Sphingopyxis]KTE20327.1 hypothetical protein ATE61_19950 [Sphingopyxis sp. H057]KTE48975.1 hypothetical protein ATE64_19900 [Sphingopyxis sp. H073]KTE53263.1 hypothetical protein ATE69_13175 [Sphingopyxis sp. H071]KTE57927.1 hypothetical protein ATE66_17530 [Sphingopyxis sp. H107]KTE61674.1 hypothetical protein ATE65_17895 [Sphingopyxis sp. H100]
MRAFSHKKFLLLATVAALVPQAAAAEAADTADAADSRDTEIVVTAQKRAQSLQDVPIAITALDEKQLEMRGIRTIEDLQYSTPGLTMSANTLNNSRLILRGVGAENPVIGGDPGVSLNMDGHYLQAGSFLTRDLFDIERIEVLRGPQGTLYGRNAVGGAVNIITKKPSGVFEGSVSLTLGNYDKRLFQAAVGGPISDRLRFRLALSNEKRDGYITNIVTGRDLNDSDYTSIRGALSFDLSERLQINVSGFYYHDDSTSATLSPQAPYTWSPLIYALYPAAATTVNPSIADGQVVAFNIDPTKEDVTYGFFADTSWDLGFATLKSITGYSNNSLKNLDFDLDLSPLNIAEQDITLDFETLTQELQLASNGNGPLSWVGGLFYYRENSQYTLPVLFNYLGLIIPNGQILTFGPNVFDSSSYAAYGQADYYVADKLQVVAGARYTYDKKRLEEDTFAPGLGLFDPATGGPIHSGPYKKHWDQFNYKLGVNWYPTSDLMLYGSYSTGYKAGGYQAGGSNGNDYDPETVDAAEIGLKSQWFDRRVTFNLSAFRYDYKNKQEYRRPPVGVSFLENAASAVSKGVEVEFNAEPVDRTRFEFALTYLSAKYKDFSSVDETNPLATGTPFACTPVPPATACPINVAGNRLTRSPEWKLSGGLEQSFDLGSVGTLTARFNTSWVGKQFTRPFNDQPYVIGSYWRSGARIVWTDRSKRFSVTGYVDNLENNDVAADKETNPSFALFLPRGTYLPPRTWGVRFGATF